MKLGKYSSHSLVWAIVAGTVTLGIGLVFLRFELEIRADGVVYPQAKYVLYAPEEGRVAQLNALPGARLEAGTAILHIENPALSAQLRALEREIIEVRAQLAEYEWTLAAHAIKPMSLEMATAATAAQKHAEIRDIQMTLAGMFAQILDQALISPLDHHLREVERLRAEIDALASEQLEEWVEAGWPALEKGRLESQRDAARERLDWLLAEQVHVTRQLDALTIRAPASGTLTALNQRDQGAPVERGDRLAVVADLDAGYLVRVYAPPRNVDLVARGQPVLLESTVYDAVLEGYAHGRVERIVPTAQEREGQSRYEIEVHVMQTPYPLMLGSPIRARIQLGRRAWWDVLFRAAGPPRRTREWETP